MSDFVDIVIEALPAIVEVVVENPPAYVEVINEQIIERIIESPVFTKTLSGFSDTIDQDEHELVIVRGMRVCKPTGELVEVAEKFNGTTVQIDSNILLDDHILTIY